MRFSYPPQSDNVTRHTKTHREKEREKRQTEKAPRKKYCQNKFTLSYFNMSKSLTEQHKNERIPTKTKLSTLFT